MEPIENSIHRPDVNDLSEIQKLAQSASAKIPSLNKAQLTMLNLNWKTCFKRKMHDFKRLIGPAMRLN
jgi:hypothetical protein